MIELDGGLPPERGEPGLPSPRHVALNAWLLAHRYLLEEVFPVRRFPSGAAIGGGGPGTAGPRALMVLSGEVAVTQVLPGSVDPYKSLYAGDVWVHPAGPGPTSEEGLFPVHLVAETACRLRVLEPKQLAAFPELEALLGGYGEFQQKKHLFFEALRNMAPFRRIRARQVVDLLDQAEIRTYARGEHLGPGREGVYLVLQGELAEVRRAVEPPVVPSERRFARTFSAGHLFGGGGMAPADGGEREGMEVRSERAAVAFIAQPPGKSQRARQDAGASGPLPELVLFRSDFSAAVQEWGMEPLRHLVDRVAEGIRTEYGDAILIVDVVPGPEVRMPRCPSPVDAQGQWVTHHRVQAPHGLAAAEGLSALARDAREWDYLFVRVAPSLWAGFTGPSGGGHGSAPVREERLAWKLVQLNAGSDEVRVPPGFEPSSTLFTVLLGRHPRRVSRADPVGTVRLRLEPRRLTHWERFEGLSSQERASVLRWGRAITGRLVGVALGGGGSWGLAGLALLQGMVERGIPIDLVSGTSFGALVASFYCGRGTEGLELLREQVSRLSWVVRASFISSEAIAWYVDRMMGGIHLEELEVPCFPVATDISNAQVHIARWGSLGSGVRASGALAGVFSPAFAEGRRLVDGGFVANVPASILKTWGASLIVAVNGVAKPPARRDAKPLFPTRVGWFLHGLNPIERAIDVMRSMILVFHTSGQQSAQVADVLFNSPFVHYSPGDYEHAQEILAQARVAARPVLETIQKKWDELRLTRRQRETVPAHPYEETPDADPNSAAG
jgi:predicted acylesterase/phospholipase RssA